MGASGTTSRTQRSGVAAKSFPSETSFQFGMAKSAPVMPLAKLPLGETMDS
jgi:hypothetical protein